MDRSAAVENFMSDKLLVRLDPKLKELLDVEASKLGLYGGMGELAAQILANYFKRPDLAKVPRKRAGRKPVKSK